MRNDPPAAALRVASSCPVRTHERAFYDHRQGSKLTPQVTIDGQTFASRLAARRHFKIGSVRMNEWIASGKAVLK